MCLNSFLVMCALDLMLGFCDGIQPSLYLGDYNLVEGPGGFETHASHLPIGLQYRSVVQSKCVCASALIVGGGLVDGPALKILEL